MTVAATRRTTSQGAISPEMRAFGLRLAHLRGVAGLTLDGLAEASGVSRSTIAGVEAGRQDLKTSRLLPLAAALRSGLQGSGLDETSLLLFLLVGDR